MSEFWIPAVFTLLAKPPNKKNIQMFFKIEIILKNNHLNTKPFDDFQLSSIIQIITALIYVEFVPGLDEYAIAWNPPKERTSSNL